MIKATHERYYYIQLKIKSARDSNNTKQLYLWKHKLEQWQLEYGAYAPIN
jgi:hypothetical protein